MQSFNEINPNFNKYIIEDLYKMSVKNLDIFNRGLDLLIQFKIFTDFTIIQKYNAIYILSNLINKCNVANVPNSSYINKLLKKCENNYKTRYLDRKNIVATNLKDFLLDE